MVSLLLTLLVLILIIFLTIFSINTLLKNSINKILNNVNETFTNSSSNLNNMDECKKMDIPLKTKLNFQTGTNIPLSPTHYEDHVGQMYIDKPNYKEKKELQDGKYCVYQNELLYDGIWKPSLNNVKDGYLQQDWKLTKGNIMNDFTCSNKLIEINKPIPKDYIDESAVPKLKQVENGIYFNDLIDDPLDIQIDSFPTEFNKGITPPTKDFIDNVKKGDQENENTLSGKKKCLYNTMCI